MSNAFSSTPASVAKRLACLSCDEVAAVLAAAGLSPGVLKAIELASVAAAESANKRRLTAADVRNDALGRMGTIRTLVELLLGRHKGALVCRRWRDATRGLALTEGEEDSLVRAVAADHTNPHLLANLRYHDVTAVELGLRMFSGTDPWINDAVVVALAEGCRHLININLHGCTGITDAAVTALATGCRKLTDIDLSETRITDAAATALAAGSLKLTNIDLSGCAITDAAVVALATGCPNLTTIDLVACDHITGAAFTALTTGCPKLRAIFLDGCTNFYLRSGQALGSCRNLTEVHISSTNVTDVCAQALAGSCPNLTKIDLSSTQVADVGAMALAGSCRNSTVICLNSTQVTDVGAMALAGSCPNLTKIYLSETLVTDVGTKALAGSCPNLTTVTLSNTQVTDVGAKAIAGSCRNLTTINLSSTQVTDVGALELAVSCFNLTKFFLTNTQVTDAGKQQMMVARPNLTIHVSEGREADAFRRGLSRWGLRPASHSTVLLSLSVFLLAHHLASHTNTNTSRSLPLQG
jgi:Leucine-rich repeat (LRR) protein